MIKIIDFEKVYRTEEVETVALNTMPLKAAMYSSMTNSGLQQN